MITAKYLNYICLNFLCALALCASQNYYQRYSHHRSPGYSQYRSPGYSQYRTPGYSYYKSSSVQVSFKQSDYIVKESDGRVAITIEANRKYYYEPFHVKIRASVNRYLRHHLASSYDFDESVQTVRFSSRQSTATCYIKINDDDRVENTEVFQVEILILHGVYPQRIQLGYPSKAKIFIKDDDRVAVTKPPITRPPSHRVHVSFSHKEYRVKESDGHVVIKAVVSGHRRFVLQVVAISFVPTKFNLPAASGTDFKVGEYKLYFPVKSNVATVKIPIYNDYIVEGTEAFAVNLYIPEYYRNRYVDYGHSFLTKVIIEDDDKHSATKSPAPTKPPAPIKPSAPSQNPVTPFVKSAKSVHVQFGQEQYVMVDESADHVPLRVTVSGRRTSAISVNIKIFVSSKFQPKAATSDDVKTGLYRMILYSHESSALIRVKILDDKVVEGIEAFGVQLIVPDHHKANGVKLGSPSFITVFIRDNDKPVTSSSIRSSPVIPPHTSSSSPPTTAVFTPIPPLTEIPPPRSSSFLILPQTTSFVPIPIPTSSSVLIPSSSSHSSVPIPSHTSTFIPIPPSTSSFVPIPSSTSSFVPIPSSTSSFIPIPIPASSSVSISLPIVASSFIQILPSSLPIVILPPTSSSNPILSPVSSSISIPLPISSIKTLSSTSSTTSSVSPSISFDAVFPTVISLPIIEVTFKEMSYSANESANSITFTIQASEVSSVSFSVQFCTQNSNPLSAEDGLDYIAVNRTIIFLPNELSVSVTVDILDDSIHEANETFIAILKASDNVVIGEQSTSVGIISDDDILAIRFSRVEYSVLESEGPISLTIVSTVASDSPFTIQVCTREVVPQSAEADSDYINLAQNITFNDGNNNSTFSVEVVDNEIAESDESFEVFLKLIPNSPYDVKLGDPSVVRVTIYDDEVPSVRLLTNRTSANESDGFVSFTLLTSFPPRDPFTVLVFTRQRNRTTATGGEDFTPVLMNVTFVPGETMKTVTVDIIPDVIIEENERFYLQLEGIEGEPNTISLPDGAWATIIDDDAEGIVVSDGDAIDTSGDDDNE